MDIISKKKILELESQSEQRTELFIIRQSAATIRDSDTPLRGWVCHVCAHFNTPGTLASPDGPCQTCTTPVCEAECADVIVTPRDNSHCSGYACWYCKYFWAWPEDEKGERIKDGEVSCTVCGQLEEDEVVFIKSWFEEHGQGQEKILACEGTKDVKTELDEVDDGEGAFVEVNRRRAKPKKKVERKEIPHNARKKL